MMWIVPTLSAVTRECDVSCAGGRGAPLLTVSLCKQSGMEAVCHAVASWAVSTRANPCLLEVMDSYKEDIEKQLTQGIPFPCCVVVCVRIVFHLCLLVLVHCAVCS